MPMRILRSARNTPRGDPTAKNVSTCTNAVKQTDSRINRALFCSCFKENTFLRKKYISKNIITIIEVF